MASELVLNLNDIIVPYLRPLLPPGNLADFLLKHAFGTLTITAFLIICLFLAAALLFDFVTDIWKLPLGIGSDILKYLGIFNPWLAIGSAILGSLSFIVVGDRWIKWLFVLGSILIAVATFPNFYGGTFIGILLALAPANTLFMFLTAMTE